MGGKKAQRTKGNTRPSNSGRTAQFLSANVASSSFVGFGAFKIVQDLSGEQRNDDQDVSIDTELHLILKKMQKKDSVTKVKALQEFSDYCQTKDEQAIKSILPFWPKLFSKLALDNDLKVREVCHKAMHQLSLKMNREIAPYLKQLIPIWLLSLFDPHPPAASAAINSFNLTFPRNKRIEVYNHCKNEIFNCCRETLLKTTLTKPTQKVDDDLANKDNRITNSSLKVLCLVLPNVDNSDAIDFLNSLLEEDKFWKLGGHEDPEVRSSWYKFKTLLCDNFPDVMSKFFAKACRTTLNNITESDPAVAAAIWENCIKLTSTNDWWKHVNFKGSFLPQLRNVLRKKSLNSSIIFPNILLLLRNLPYNLMDNVFQFVIDLFENFTEAFRNTENLHTDFIHVVVSFFDCLKYFTTTCDALTTEEKESVLRGILENHVKKILQKFLMDVNAKKRNSMFYSQFINFVNEWDGVPQQTLALDCIREICVKTIENARDNIDVLMGLTFFLNDMFSVEKTKSNRHVQFGDSKSSTNAQMTPVVSDVHVREYYKNILSVVVRDVVKIIESGPFNSKWLVFLQHLTKTNCFTYLDAEEKKHFNCRLRSYLLDSISNSNEDLKQKEIDLLTNLMFKLYEASECKEELFHELVNNADPLVLVEVTRNIKLRSSSDTIIRDWIESDAAIDYVLLIANELVKRIYVKDKSILEWNALWDSLILFISCDFLSKKCLNEVISLFEEAIRNSNTNSSGELMDFVCEVTENMFKLYPHCETLSSMKTLLFDFFKLSCHPSCKRDKLVSVWTKGAELMWNSGMYVSEGGLLYNIANEFHNLLNGHISSYERFSVINDNLEIFLKTINKFTSFEDDDENDENTMDLIFDAIFLSEEEWRLLNSSFSCDFINFLVEGMLVPSNTEVVKTNSSPLPVVYSAIVTMNSLNMLSNTKRSSTQYSVQFLESCLSYSYCKMLSSFLIYKPHEDIHMVFKVIEESYKKMIENYKGLLQNEFLLDFNKKSLESNFLRNLALKHFLDNCEHLSLPASCDPQHEDLSYENTASLQLLLPHYKNIFPHFYEQLLHKFLCQESVLQCDSVSLLPLIDSCLRAHVTLSFEDHVNPLLDYFLGLKDQKSNVFIFESNSDFLKFGCSLVSIFEVIVRKWIHFMNRSQLDLILCSLTSWIMSLCPVTNEIVTNASLVIFSRRCFDLVKTVANTLKDDTSHSYVEWNDFHSKKIYSSLVHFLLSFKNTPQEDIPQIYHLQCALTEALKSIPKHCEAKFSPVLQKIQIDIQEVDEKRSLQCIIPMEEDILLSNLRPLMLQRVRPLYFSAHLLTLNILQDVAVNLTVKTNEEEDDCYITPPSALLSVLQQSDLMVDMMLSEYKVGDCCCIVDPTTDGYHFTMSYLLSCIQLLEYFTHLNPENKSLLASFLTESGILFRLLNNVFRLMPINEYNDTTQQMLTTPFTVDVTGIPSPAEIQHLSCQVYVTALKKMPASVRLWISNHEKRVVDTVNQFTSSHVSNFMCAEEFKSVQSANLSNLKNITVKSRPVAKEIVALYSIEDMSIELTIQFPINHPISPVTIDSGRRVGVSSSQWRTWLLQLTTFLTHQNGSIIDGLLLWKKNIDKRFEGVEECMICCYILHGSNCQLPKLSCKHCKKKYHSACLFKWFKTSNNATCPLCRNLFETRV